MKKQNKIWKVALGRHIIMVAVTGVGEELQGNYVERRTYESRAAS